MIDPRGSSAGPSSVRGWRTTGPSRPNRSTTERWRSACTNWRPAPCSTNSATSTTAASSASAKWTIVANLISGESPATFPDLGWWSNLLFISLLCKNLNLIINEWWTILIFAHVKCQYDFCCLESSVLILISGYFMHFLFVLLSYIFEHGSI